MAVRGNVVPSGIENLNGLGSFYAANYGKGTTDLLNLAIEKEIFDNANKRFDTLKLINMTKIEEVLGTEFRYLTKIWSRDTHVVQSATAPGATVVVTLKHEANYYDNYFPFEKNTLVQGSDGGQYIVTATSKSSSANASTITIKAPNSTSGGGAGTIATQFVLNDEFVVKSVLKADGMTTLTGSVKPEFIENYNYLEIFERKTTWTRMQIQEIANLGRTNAMSFEWKQAKEEIQLDLFASVVNGQKNEYDVADANSSGTLKARTMDGFYTMMVNGGAQHANPTEAGLVTAFEQLALATNMGVDGNTRFVLGTSEMLYMLQKGIKGEKVRYAPNDMIANLQLDEWKIGGASYVFVNVELFSKKAGVLPAEFDRKLICIDLNSVSRRIMKGIPAIEMITTDDVTKGTEKDATIYAVRATLSLSMNQVDGSFYIDVQ